MTNHRLTHLSAEQQYAEIRKVVANDLQAHYAAEQFSDNDEFKEDLGLDSLDFVELVIRSERELNLTTSDKDLEDVKTVSDLINVFINKIPCP